MRAFGVISTTALFLLLGTAVPAFSQEEQRKEEAKPEKQTQEAKPTKQEEKAKPAKQQDAATPAKQEQQAKQEKQDEKAKPAKQQDAATPAKQEQQTKQVKQEEQAKPGKQEERSKPAAQQHAQRSAAEEQRQRAVPELRLSVRGSGRVPDERFRADFGEGHRFVINEPVVVGGYSRFQYSGFWFGFVNPWPVEWYYTDDVYVDYIDGDYYLCNPYYPDTRLAISVVI
jgi:primosomal protein N'